MGYVSVMRFLSPARIGRFVLAAGVWSLVSALAHGQLSFTRLGALSYPTDVASDGTSVIGRNYPGYDLLRWSKESGAVFLKGNALAIGTSANGQTVVATTLGASVGNSDTIHKWTATEGFLTIAANQGGYLAATGLSGDGQITVGNLGLQAVRWIGTTPELLGTLPGGSTSFARAISEDGKTIVGYGGTADPNVPHAFRWTESTGMIDMGLLGGATSVASNVSADGAFIVGHGVRADQRGITAFIWNEATGHTTLGPGMPVAVSTDALVVGSYYPGGNQLEQGFLWSPESGFRAFPSVLTGDYGFGAELDDWQNLIPTEMSSDGRYIVGYGLSVEGLTEGWLLDRGLNPPDITPGFAPVPEPSAFGVVGAALLVGVVFVNLRRRKRASCA